jgi:glycosyltransferase involved in cell wall biosynthesis
MNNDEKILTISIPTWNRSSLLEELLTSLTTQINNCNLNNKIQLLVSNNSSDDNTEQVALFFASKFNFIAYRKNDSNIGAKSNVLLSMESATTPYVMFIGDDDRISISNLKIALEVIEKNNVGILLDTCKSKTPRIFKDGILNHQVFFRDYFYYMGNAGLFITKTLYFKKYLKELTYDFFNECWPQTQCMTLGIENDSEAILIAFNIDIAQESLHDEVMVYNSYYLWRTVVYDLLISLNNIKSMVSRDIYEAARLNFKQTIKQNFLNIMQCGVYLDTIEIRRKTSRHILKYLHLFNLKEKAIFIFAVIILTMPTFISKKLSDLFIRLTRGKSGITKKNAFVTSEKLKINNKKESIRTLVFEKK